MTTYRVFILDWGMYHGVSCDACMKDLAPGIWAVALATHKYETYTIEADNVEDVFMKLNVNHPADYHFRSMSAGDVAVDMVSKKAYVCAAIGWHELNIEWPLSLTAFLKG